MSEHSTPEERTELPTEKRMSKLREEGQLPLSTDFTQATTLIGGFLILQFIWSWLYQDMVYTMRKAFGMIADKEPLTVHKLQEGLIGLLLLFGPEIVMIAGLVALIATFTVFFQTDWNVRKKWIKFRWSSLNPVNGVKRILSIQGVVTTGKAILKLLLILPIGYFGLVGFAPEMISLMHLTVQEVLSYLGVAIHQLFWQIAYVLIALAIFDLVWSRFQWLKQNKMTKDEVKDERKSIEGDEATKKKIQNKGLQRIAQRIFSSVPQADVVITNPTHFAVALKYDREHMSAPQVVAKGRGYLALRIRKIAKESGVPIVERKPLARALYASCEVGTEIPHDLFKAVAEVLAYVYRLKNPHAYQAMTR